MSRREVTRWARIPVEELRERWGREAVHAFGKIDSTNSAARELALEGAPAGTIVVAREQTEGRGRMDRTWHSPRDKGVYLSMIFRPEGRSVTPALSILAALGVVRRLDQRFSRLEPRVKWPNDFMAHDRKFGGILGETSRSESGDARFVVMGVGINVKPMAAALPKALRSLATWIQEHEPDVELLEVADAVISGLESRLDASAPTLESDALELLDRYDWLRERRVRVKQTREEAGTVGVCVGIAPDGALLFRPDRGALRRLSSAIVEPEPA